MDKEQSEPGWPKAGWKDKGGRASERHSGYDKMKKVRAWLSFLSDAMTQASFRFKSQKRTHESLNEIPWRVKSRRLCSVLQWSPFPGDTRQCADSSISPSLLGSLTLRINVIFNPSQGQLWTLAQSRDWAMLTSDLGFFIKDRESSQGEGWRCTVRGRWIYRNPHCFPSKGKCVQMSWATSQGRQDEIK